MKTSFFLTAGGSKAAFQWGAIAQLKKEGIKPNKIWGTSGGALNAVLLSVAGVLAGTELWKETEERDIYKGCPLWRLLTLRSSLYSSKPLKSRLANLLNANKEVTVPVSVIAVDLESGEPKTFHHDDPDFEKAVLASASIPGVFPPVKIRGRWYVDGGVREYTPLSYVIEDSDLDADRVVVISTKSRSQVKEFDLGKHVRPWEMVKSTLPIMTDEIFKGDFKTFETINEAVKQAEASGGQFLRDDGTPYRHYDYIYIEPKEDFGSPLKFSRDRNLRLIEAGREAAKNTLKNYR